VNRRQDVAGRGPLLGRSNASPVRRWAAQRNSDDIEAPPYGRESLRTAEPPCQTRLVADDSYPVLVGSLCALKVLTSDDAAAWHAGEDDEQRRWFEFPHPAPLENVFAAIGRWHTGWETGGPLRHWGVWHHGALAGGVELRVRDDRRANLSYVVFPPYRRKGIATEAATLAACWAFAHLRVVALVGVVDERNAASIGVLHAAGFRYEGYADEWEHDSNGVMLRFALQRPGDSDG
jgi:[ribosomal protein S5]-alanine N-acetyltransferase